MMCLRGPCVHLWRLVTRFDSAVKSVMRERVWTCLAGGIEEFDLNERLVYFCDRWWPRAPLLGDDGELLKDDDGDELISLSDVLKVREESRGLLRPELHETWEEGLRLLGYDFSWRDFDPEDSPDDAPDRRANCAPGTLETVEEAEAREAAEALPPAGSIPEDDPPPEKTPEEEEAEAEAEYIHQMLLKRQREEAGDD
jgi:hypothetical protein